MSLLHISLLIVFIFVCFLLISSVLLQTGKGGGMAGLGGGSSDTAFGAHTANVLQKFTMWCVIGFFGLVITLSHMSKSGDDNNSVMDSFVAPAPATATQEVNATAPVEQAETTSIPTTTVDVEDVLPGAETPVPEAPVAPAK
jgi:preprotein translocase subunit SecG